MDFTYRGVGTVSTGFGDCNTEVCGDYTHRESGDCTQVLVLTVLIGWMCTVPRFGFDCTNRVVWTLPNGGMGTVTNVNVGTVPNVWVWTIPIGG